MRLRFTPGRHASSVLVLGMFDGLHVGHRALLRQARMLASAEGVPACVYTFRNHPLQVIFREKAPPMLTTLNERIQVMASLGVEELTIVPFTQAIADQPAELFLQDMLRCYKPSHIVIGFNYTFGRGGEGNAAFLKDREQLHGYRVSVIPPVRVDGEVVSSTRVRALLAAGDIAQVNRMLARPYSLSGTVVKGRGLGHVLGFPTANLHVPAMKAMPLSGVYVSEMVVHGETFAAVTNIGMHPTLPGGGTSVETHLIGVTRDLYAAHAEVKLYAHIREEKRFASEQALKAQIECDISEARRWSDRQ